MTTSRFLREDAAAYAKAFKLSYKGNPKIVYGGTFMVMDQYDAGVIPAVRVLVTMLNQTLVVERVLVQIPAEESRRVSALFHCGVPKDEWEDPDQVSWACLWHGYQSPVVQDGKPLRRIYAFEKSSDHDDMDVTYVDDEAAFCEILKNEWLVPLIASRNDP